MKSSAISALSVPEIKARIQEEKANLVKLKFAHAVTPIENPRRISNLKKTIARLNTELTRRQAIEETTTRAESNLEQNN